MAEQATQAKPLQGVKIVELSSVVTAALAATIMSEQGATTVKVEPPGIGDLLRHLGCGREGVGAIFANCNRGKRSIAVDLKTPEGVEIVRKLAAEADVLISNYRPGVLERLGLGSETLRAANPRLIYVAISGFGTEGPLSSAPAYDHVIQALCGFTDVQGPGEQMEAVKTFVCDEVTAYTACQATTAALYQRSATGQGQHIDISMLDAAIYFLWPGAMAEQTFRGEGVYWRPSLKMSYRTYPTRDGYVTIAPMTEAHWQGLFAGSGRQDLAEDPRFATMEARLGNFEIFIEEFQLAFAELTTAQVEAMLLQYDVPGGRCLEVGEVADHPQVQATGAVGERSHPLLGDMRVPAHPAKFGGARVSTPDCLGALGEHGAEVLQDLGYSADEVDDLRDRGILGT